MKKFFLILTGVIFAIIIFLAIKTIRFYQTIYTPQKKQAEKKEKTSYNILLFGYGGGSHEGTYLTDTIILAHLDSKNKKLVLLSIPRDLWVKVPSQSKEDFYSKVNALYQMELFSKNYPHLDQKYLGTKEDAALVKFVISYILNQPIDYYLAVDFEGFKKAIDILGGIDVDVKQSFVDPEYPIEGKEKDLCDEKTEAIFKKAEPFLKPGYNPLERDKIFSEDPQVEEFVRNATQSPYLAFPCRYQRLEFKKGLTHMDGETALKYARSRHSSEDGGDFNRARRQQQIIEAVKNKALSLGIITKVIPLFNQLKDDFKTDIDIDQIKKFSVLASQASEYQISSYVLTTENYLKETFSFDGQYILIPKIGIDNWSEIQTFVKNIFEGVVTTPTLTPKK